MDQAAFAEYYQRTPDSR